MNTVQQIPSGHREFVSDVAFDYYGKRLVTASADGYLRVWNVINEKWELQVEMKAHTSLISRVDWAHPLFGQLFGACLHNDAVAVYQETLDDDKKKNWSKRCTIVMSSPCPTSLSFSPHIFGLNLAISCKDGNVCIYKPIDLLQLWNWQCDSSFNVFKTVNSISWCKSRNHPMSVVVATEDDAQIWELNAESHHWEMRYELKDHDGIVRDVAWSYNIGKDYEVVATACSDGNIRIYEVRDSAAALTACLTGHGKDVWRLEWNATGSILASSGDDDEVRMWKQRFDGTWCCVSEIHS